MKLNNLMLKKKHKSMSSHTNINKLFKSAVLLAGFTSSTLYAGDTTPHNTMKPSNTKQALSNKSTNVSPYQVNYLYTGEEWENAKGGIQRGSSYMNNVDLKLMVDTAKAYGWKGGRFLLEGFYENSVSTGRQYVGAVDQQSPIDTAINKQLFRLYQLFYDQNFGKTDILIGIYDLETEYSVTKPMSLFLSKNLTWNTALDQAGTMPHNGLIGPGNYPYTPLAARIREDLNPYWHIQATIADGASDNPNDPTQNGVYFSSKYGALGIGEIDYTPKKFTKIMAGVWGLTSQLPANITYLDGTPRMIWGQEGGYVGATTRVYAPPEGGFKGLDAFFTLGFAHGD